MPNYRNIILVRLCDVWLRHGIWINNLTWWWWWQRRLYNVEVNLQIDNTTCSNRYIFEQPTHPNRHETYRFIFGLHVRKGVLQDEKQRETNLKVDIKMQMKVLLLFIRSNHFLVGFLSLRDADFIDSDKIKKCYRPRGPRGKRQRKLIICVFDTPCMNDETLTIR